MKNWIPQKENILELKAQGIKLEDITYGRDLEKNERIKQDGTLFGASEYLTRPEIENILKMVPKKNKEIILWHEKC